MSQPQPSEMPRMALVEKDLREMTYWEVCQRLHDEFPGTSKDNNVNKGRCFENFVAQLLSKDPIWKKRLKPVGFVRLEESDRRTGPDNGVDLIGELKDGRFCAVQCKCHKENQMEYPIKQDKVDSFIASSLCEPFGAEDERLFICTTESLTTQARRRFEQFSLHLNFLGLNAFHDRMILIDPKALVDVGSENPIVLKVRIVRRSRRILRRVLRVALWVFLGAAIGAAIPL